MLSINKNDVCAVREYVKVLFISSLWAGVITFKFFNSVSQFLREVKLGK